MTDTTKLNGDDKHSADWKAAENPCGSATGPPAGTASSGRTSQPLDMAVLRELAAELGFWPATTNPDDIEAHRQHNRNADYWLARRHRFDHLKKTR